MKVNNIEYTKCYIAFLDILGFKEKVIESSNSINSIKLLIDSLNICAAFPTGGKKISVENGKIKIISVQSRFFSDSIVYFIKEESKRITHLLFMIRHLQDRLWEYGICLRGAVGIGDMYWPNDEENITLGPAMIDVYKLESSVAVYPRILVGNKLHNHIKENEFDAYPFAKGKLVDFIKHDNDGLFFLDLLNSNIIRANVTRKIKLPKKWKIKFPR